MWVWEGGGGGGGTGKALSSARGPGVMVTGEEEVDGGETDAAVDVGWWWRQQRRCAAFGVGTGDPVGLGATRKRQRARAGHNDTDGTEINGGR